jgi:hypothetical protein
VRRRWRVRGHLFCGGIILTVPASRIYEPVTVFDVKKVSRHQTPPGSECPLGGSVPLYLISRVVCCDQSLQPIFRNLSVGLTEDANDRQGIEFSIRQGEPDLWKWQFKIADTVTMGQTGLAAQWVWRPAEFKIRFIKSARPSLVIVYEAASVGGLFRSNATWPMAAGSTTIGSQDEAAEGTFRAWQNSLNGSMERINANVELNTKSP